ncbi:hypothetical protein MD484_g7406, partial [Candolleomyces efflorescens]
MASPNSQDDAGCGSDDLVEVTYSDGDSMEVEVRTIVDSGLDADSDGFAELLDSDDSGIIPAPRRTLPRMVNADPTGDTPPPNPTHPCGRSTAATRVKGRGFLLPPPQRTSEGTQTHPSPACIFGEFLANPTYDENGRLFVDAYAYVEKPFVPTDSVEAHEVMRDLDSCFGIPADQFLHLFHGTMPPSVEDDRSLPPFFELYVP